jgi:hypothetical protein
LITLIAIAENPLKSSVVPTFPLAFGGRFADTTSAASYPIGRWFISVVVVPTFAIRERKIKRLAAFLLRVAEVGLGAKHGRTGVWDHQERDGM